jgi:pyridoxine kinase
LRTADSLKRAVEEDYRTACFDDPSTNSSLDIRLVQSLDQIRNPAVTCRAARYGSC